MKNPRIIDKKIWPDKFDIDQKLPVDFRIADFNLQNGDIVRFREWDPKTKKYTGREYIKTVKRVTKLESPTYYWKIEDLEKHGMYIMEWEE